MVHIVNNTPLGTKSPSTKLTEGLFAAACPRHQNCQFWANANQISGQQYQLFRAAYCGQILFSHPFLQRMLVTTK